MTSLAEAALRAAHARTRRTTPSTLRAHGIVPTPVALARAALTRVDQLLRCELGVRDGLASERVAVLDPAVGTGVWLAGVLDLTQAHGRVGTLIGIDLDADSLRETRALLEPAVVAQGGRLQLRCENTLALESAFEDDDRVRVIVGNPPWAARSASRGCALSDGWLEEFRRDLDGRPLRERRSGVLSDDYVRFVRWSLEQARTAPQGALVCLATNGSFLDGPVHRGMRAALVAGFDVLEVVDLGGNALLSRGEERDENVFGVRVGAALTLAVRRPTAGVRTARVAYARLQGTRTEKLEALPALVAAPIAHAPSAPWYALRPHTSAPRAEGFSLDEAFVFHREGVQTNRDALAVAPTQAALLARLRCIVDGSLVLRAAPHFDADAARAQLARALDRGPPPIERLAYRPLDERWYVTLAPLCHRPRAALRTAVAHGPLSLVGVRKERGAAAFNLFGVVRSVADACYLSTRSSCRTRMFPSAMPDGSDNVAPAVAEAFAARGGQAPSGEALIAYALGVLGSPRHRAAHDAALKQDYARLPWPRSPAHYQRVLEVGRAFIAAACAPQVEKPAFRLAVDTTLDLSLGADALTFDAAGGRVLCAGRPLLEEVEPRWWGVRVGHHGLVASGLSVVEPTLTLARLVEVLSRAAEWTRAEDLADACFSLD